MFLTINSNYSRKLASNNFVYSYFFKTSLIKYIEQDKKIVHLLLYTSATSGQKGKKRVLNCILTIYFKNKIKYRKKERMKSNIAFLKMSQAVQQRLEKISIYYLACITTSLQKRRRKREKKTSDKSQIKNMFC